MTLMSIASKTGLTAAGAALLIAGAQAQQTQPMQHAPAKPAAPAASPATAVAANPLAANAAVQVEGAWVRATVPGQKGTGAFMRLTAKEGARLVGASSPAAGVTEVHEMKMEGNVMRMRAIEGLDLPAGKAVELKPGGYHVMLLDLKSTLVKDTTVPLTLTLKDARGNTQRIELTVPVSVMPPAGSPGVGAMPSAPSMPAGHKH